ncbi:MAG: PD40 domain-containing protein [Cyclobacteriaceae bacterium]|nr:PD40 domain-containing protein [Cyclobacteriaceae bacterium]
MYSVRRNLLILTLLLLFSNPAFSNKESWVCKILPAEREVYTDPSTGLQMTFITNHKAEDLNLYFHDRSWLPKNDIVLFTSDRSGRREIYGYSEKSGNIIAFNPENQLAAFNPVASRFRNEVFVFWKQALYVWQIESNDQVIKVTAIKLTDLPENAVPISSINENSNGKVLCYAYRLAEKYHIGIINIEEARSEIICQTDFEIQHLQFSHERSGLLSFARSYGTDTAPAHSKDNPHARIWLLDIEQKVPLPAFYQVPGELVTHECWWVNDRITFIGGHRPEEGHVKTFDLKTGEIVIKGAGAWMPDQEPQVISRYNWWHAAGSPDGKWIAADNWHGVIAIFDAKSTRMHILTENHRVYGKGAHPHVGWDNDGKKIIFSSNLRGNADVCIMQINKP